MSSPTRIQAVRTSSQIVLSADEDRIIRAYRQLKDSEQACILRFTEASAEDPEARRSVIPFLRIISGGAA
jgi:hypothetical protein